MDTKVKDNILYIINRLKEFWSQYGIEEIPSLCMPVGAATYHPFCLISALSKNSYNAMYINACVRHDDANEDNFQTSNKAFHRYVQHYQFQVLWKNAPLNILELYGKSLEYIGMNHNHTIKYYNSKWETLSMGAFGYGYEIYANELEITQFTYFQQICDVKINGTFVEIAYGIERLAIALYNKKINELYWSNNIPYNVLRLSEESHRGNAYALLPIENRIEFLCNNVSILCEHKLYAAALLEWLKANDNFNEMNARSIFDQATKKKYMDVLRLYAHKIGKMYSNELKIDDIVDILNNNGVVILPTETVYGIFTKTNVDAIYEIKKRSTSLKLGYYINELPNWLTEHEKWPILEKYIPGPMCIIYNNQAYRFVNNSIFQKVIEKVDYLYGTSANISGQYSAININMCDDELSTLEYIDDGNTQYCFESTIIDLDDNKILRHGVIDMREHFNHEALINKNNSENKERVELSFNNFYEHIKKYDTSKIYIVANSEYEETLLNNTIK